jgi:hypothetical protein
MMADKNLKVRGDGDGWPQKGAKDAKWELLAVGFRLFGSIPEPLVAFEKFFNLIMGPDFGSFP